MKTYQVILVFVWLTNISYTSSAQQHSFKKYDVPLYHGPKATLIIQGNSLAHQYRTAIKDTYYSKKEQVNYHGATGLNFAGHYCFVYVGCGSDCQLSFVVDVKTGIIYRGLDASLGYKFKRNSALITINPDGDVISKIFKTEYWVWSERNKKFNRL